MPQKKPSKRDRKSVKNSTAGNESKTSNDSNDIAQESESKGKIKRITFEVSEQQHQATKILAAQKGMTIKELMLSLLVTELIKNE